MEGDFMTGALTPDDMPTYGARTTRDYDYDPEPVRAEDLGPSLTCVDCRRTNFAVDTVRDGRDVLCVPCCSKRFRDEDAMRGLAA
jgi:hypothetical protein